MGIAIPIFWPGPRPLLGPLLGPSWGNLGAILGPGPLRAPEKMGIYQSFGLAPGRSWSHLGDVPRKEGSRRRRPVQASPPVEVEPGGHCPRRLGQPLAGPQEGPQQQDRIILYCMLMFLYIYIYIVFSFSFQKTSAIVRSLCNAPAISAAAPRHGQIENRAIGLDWTLRLQIDMIGISVSRWTPHYIKVQRACC